MSAGIGLNGPATSSAVMVYVVSIGLPSAARAAATAPGAMLRARANAATARLWLDPSTPSISPGEKCARSSMTCIQRSLSAAGTAAAAARASADGLAIDPIGPPTAGEASIGLPPGSGEPYASAGAGEAQGIPASVIAL